MIHETYSDAYDLTMNAQERRQVLHSFKTALAHVYLPNIPEEITQKVWSLAVVGPMEENGMYLTESTYARLANVIRLTWITAYQRGIEEEIEG